MTPPNPATPETVREDFVQAFKRVLAHDCLLDAHALGKAYLEGWNDAIKYRDGEFKSILALSQPEAQTVEEMHDILVSIFKSAVVPATARKLHAAGYRLTKAAEGGKGETK